MLSKTARMKGHLILVEYLFLSIISRKFAPFPIYPSSPTQKVLYLPKRNGTVVGVVAIENVWRIDVLQLDVLRVQPHVWIPQGYPEPCQTQIVILRPDQRQIYNTTVVAGR